MQRTLPFLVPLLDEMQTHWQAVNAWGATQITLLEMKVQGKISLTDFNALVLDFTNNQDDVVTTRGAVNDAGASLEAQRIHMRKKLRQFRGAVKDVAAKTRYEKDLPTLPQLTAGKEIFGTAMSRMREIWSALDANTNLPDFDPPLLLRNNYALANFTVDRNMLEAKFDGFAAASRALIEARASRDAVRVRLDAICDRYRARVENFLPEGHPLLASIPQTSPPKNVVIPPLKANATWDAVAGHPVVTWVGEVHPRCVRFEVRISPAAPKWDADASTVTATALPTATSVALAPDVVPADSFVWGKTFAVLDNGQERGSNAFKIPHPE